MTTKTAPFNYPDPLTPELNATGGEVYNIDRRAWETECGECGAPLYIGDMAYEAPDGHIYCCRSCARDHERRYQNTRQSEP